MMSLPVSATRTPATGRRFRPSNAAIDAALDLLVSRRPLEEVAERARRLTRRQFAVNAVSDSGNMPCSRSATKHRVLLYAPVYLSSYCRNRCTYCGFRGPEAIERRHLTVEEGVEQAEWLMRRGIRHILLVAGDFPELTTPEYFADVASVLTERGCVVGVEIAPQTVEGYRVMVEAGVRSVTLYQETYDKTLYGEYHPAGSKADYDGRRDAPARALEAGVERMGLGVLLGLADPREDLRRLMLHGAELLGTYDDRTIAFSLPRIHEAPAGFNVPHTVDDETFIRMYCALRIAFPEAELVLSTRESEAMRSRLTDICITQLSAGSSTAPGGYSDESEHPGEQFPVTDNRSIEEVARSLTADGLDIRWSF